jgi:type II secretory pathway pseudopilin PulG
MACGIARSRHFPMSLVSLQVPAGDVGWVLVNPDAPPPVDGPSRRRPLRGNRTVPCADAFTVVELLSVMALIAAFCGFTLDLARGVNERAATARAKAELAVIAQAIESWRCQYGDYPSVGGSAELYECLTGRRGPQGDALDPPGRTWIDAGRFALQFSDAAAPGNALLDPWGQPYNYVSFTRTIHGCVSDGFVVFSNGPDGRAKPDDPPAAGSAAGQPDLTAPDNADNLYSDR